LTKSRRASARQKTARAPARPAEASEARSRREIADVFAETIAAHHAALATSAASIHEAAASMQQALGAGGKVLVFGNGGSAADSQHFAAELVNRFRFQRAALAAVALTTDTSILTSVANDDDYSRVFSRQIEALGRAGDVALGITTSGGSRNVIAGLAQASRQGMTTIALVGARPVSAAQASICITVPAASTARVQEVHRTILHILCQLIENSVA